MAKSLYENKSFIINSFDQAKNAIQQNLGSRVSLVSTHNSTKNSGPSYFIYLKEELEKIYKELNIVMWIDCGKDPGLVMNTIRHGGKNIIFSNPEISEIYEMALTKNVKMIDSISDVIDLSKN
ncbi:MAG: hypothetical protein CFH01_01419 [Alphaproteobacteria bacterium MarineAlpha2_Bin1]|nr:MAG: hypothetical protein CFH01_01419 [Alphaproteobacteria bacterium MarineAlpha2_Bin1]|tara:strand:+ start:1586 stop:1954 length:369 start_codon:yes stop_codon:yes gene_type:complete